MYHIEKLKIRVLGLFIGICEFLNVESDLKQKNEVGRK